MGSNVFYEPIVYNQHEQDLIQQKIKKHYKKPRGYKNISNHPITRDGYTIPKTYLDYSHGIQTLLHPVNISTSGTADMIIDIFNDLTVGSNISVLSENQLKNYKVRADLSKLVRIADTFGTACMIGDDVLTTEEFYYYESEQLLIYLTYVDVKGSVEIIYESRQYVAEAGLLEFKQWNSNLELITVEHQIPYGKGWDEDISDRDNYLILLGAYIMTYNNTTSGWAGYSILEPIIQDLMTHEMVQDEYNKAVMYSKPRLHIVNDMVDIGEDGKPNIDLTTDVYVTTEANYADDPKKIIEAVQFDIKSDEYHQKTQDSFNLILSKVGLDESVLAISSSTVDKTTKEVSSNDNRMFSKMESRKVVYAPQIYTYLSAKYPEVQLHFIPAQYKNFGDMVLQVTKLKKEGMISVEHGVNLLYGNASEAEKAEEVSRIKGEEQNGTDRNVTESTTDI